MPTRLTRLVCLAACEDEMAAARWHKIDESYQSNQYWSQIIDRLTAIIVTDAVKCFKKELYSCDAANLAGVGNLFLERFWPLFRAKFEASLPGFYFESGDGKSGPGYRSNEVDATSDGANYSSRSESSLRPLPLLPPQTLLLAFGCTLSFDLFTAADFAVSIAAAAAPAVAIVRPKRMHPLRHVIDVLAL